MTSQTKWSAFPLGTAITSADIVVGLQGGINVQWTYLQLAASGGVFPLVAAAGSDITIAGQALLDAIGNAGGGTFLVGQAGTYYLSNHLLVSSHTKVVLGEGVTIKKVANATNNVCMLRNKNMQSTDTNISVIGGTWDGNYANNHSSVVASDKTGALTGVAGDLSFIGVANLTVSNITRQNSNGFGIQWIGVGAVFENISWGQGLQQDGLHINGPSSNFFISNVRGYTVDDFIALNAWDWTISSPSVGDITDGVIDGLFYEVPNGSATTAGFVKFLPGTRSATQANVRRIAVSNCGGEVHDNAFKFCLDTNMTYGPSGVGQISDITIANVENVKVTNSAAYLQFTQNTANVTVDGLSYNPNSVAAQLLTVAAGKTVDRLAINGFLMTSGADALSDIKGTITELLITNSNVIGVSSDNCFLSPNNGGAITRLIIDNLVQTAGGSVIYVQSNAASSETDVMISNSVITAVKHPFFGQQPMRVRATGCRFVSIPNDIARVDGTTFDGQFDACEASYNGGVPYTRVNSATIRHRSTSIAADLSASIITGMQAGDIALNSNAGLSFGAGQCLYNGTAWGAITSVGAAPTAVGTGTKTISSSADSSTNFGHYFAISLNGTVYYVPCGATAPT